MRRLAASFFLLASAVALSQTNTQTSNPPATIKGSADTPMAATVTVLPTVPATSDCPIGFSANRQATGQIMSANDAKQAGPAQGLHLVLNNLENTPAIESIEVKVYGTSPKPRVLPLGMQSGDTAVKLSTDLRSGSQSSETVAKNFEFHRKTSRESLSEADVWMHKVGSLSWVDLISITYADGTTWHTTANLKCRAVPSDLLLVGSK
jgi:hypothetical protein